MSQLPQVPFDGQEFIDAYRIKWVYDASIKCWRRVGAVSDVPLASETQNGLLSRRLKELLDSIPSKGGHFGIIAKPLLSVVPQDMPVELKDKAFGAVKNESGSVIYGIKPRRGEPYNKAAFDGYFIRFTNGALKGDTFLIYTNDETSLILQGDASEAQNEDEFIVFDPLKANENGVIMGDIQIVSDTIDITCVDSNNNPINFSKDCRLDYKDSDAGKQRPGLDFKVAEKVLDSFCVELRSCKGPKGDRGPKGDSGADGTGDGPQGEAGDPGLDAPDVAHKFTGIKFIESDDIYDTAVIGLELDSDAGKLHVLKAKLKVPGNDDPATQVIASPINRSLEWTDEEFGYKLLKPLNDPIETKDPTDADVHLSAYPDGYEIDTTGSDAAKTRVTQFVSINLSDLIDKAIDHFRDRLEDIGDEYNRQIKTFIEEKDAKARTILAGLAQDLSACEWQIPLEFCIGITPDDCREDNKDGDGGGGGTSGGAPTPWPNPGDTPRFPTPHQVPAPSPTVVPGGSPTPGPGFTPTPLPEPDPSPTPAPTPSPTPTPTYQIVWSGKLTWEGMTTLPENAAFVMMYLDGSFRTRSSANFISANDNTAQEGLLFSEEIGGALATPKAFHADKFDPQDKNSIEAAYKALASSTYLVFGGSAPVKTVWAWIQAREELLPEAKVRFNVIALYDPKDPPPGVPVTTTQSIGGTTPTTPTDPVVTYASPNTIWIGAAPITVTIYGKNFQDGATIQFLSATANPESSLVAVLPITVAADGNSLSLKVHAPIIGPPPMPEDAFNVLIVNPDGSNAIGYDIINSVNI